MLRVLSSSNVRDVAKRIVAAHSGREVTLQPSGALSMFNGYHRTVIFLYRTSGFQFRTRRNESSEAIHPGGDLQSPGKAENSAVREYPSALEFPDVGNKVVPTRDPSPSPDSFGLRRVCRPIVRTLLTIFRNPLRAQVQQRSLGFAIEGTFLLGRIRGGR